MDIPELKGAESPVRLRQKDIAVPAFPLLHHIIASIIASIIIIANIIVML